MKAATTLVLISLLSLQSFSQSKDSSSINIKSNQQTNTGSHSFLRGKNLAGAKPFIVPAVFVGYGFTSLGHNSLRQLNQNISHEVTEDMPGFNTRVDDYLKYAPVVTAYALNVAGVKAKHKLIDRTIVFAASSIITNQLVTTLKHATHQMRPDGSTYNSFPSGHTATAFVGAEFMNQELGWHSRWYSAVGYTMAGTTGALRIANNRHWFGDVIAGAGIGILTAKFTYWVYGKVEQRIHKRQAKVY